MSAALATKRILVPLTLDGEHEIDVSLVAQQAHAMHADVIVLRVLGSVPAPAGEVSLEESVARAQLETVTSQLGTTGVHADALVRFGRAATAVRDTAVEHQVSLIIVGRPQRKGLTRLLPPGAADAIARQAPCPVLITAAPATAARTSLRRFDDDVQRAGTVAPRYLGARTIELPRIVGTVTRVDGLDRDFRPLRRRPDEEQHYRHIAKMMEQHPEQMAPVDLYKLGYGYYVFSGHAQVAAAKQLGQRWIDAVVTEYLPAGNRDAVSVLDERNAFERTTGLARVGAARPGSYPALRRLIESFGAAHQIADSQEAARRWYVNLFRPSQRLLREKRVHEHFPGERSADIVLRVARYMEARTAAREAEMPWREAIVAFAEELRQPGRIPLDRAA